MSANQEILFSLIIPAYNAGEYLQRCVISVLEQTRKNFEIIVVDDGSTDLETQEIENELAKDHSQVVLISQSNQGTSVARNTGMQQAKGAYVSFLDQDDYWNRKDVLENIERIINTNDPDLIFSNFFLAKNGSLKERTCHVGGEELRKIPSKDNRIEYLVRKNGMGRTVWSVFFRRSFLEKHQIQFPPHARYEDFGFLASCLEEDCSVDWLPTPYYVYNLGLQTQQTNQKVSKKMCKDLEESISRHLASCKDNPGFQAYLSFLQFILLCEEIKILGTKAAYKKYSAKAKGEIFFQQLKEFPYSLFGFVYSAFGLRAMIYCVSLALKTQARTASLS